MTGSAYQRHARLLFSYFIISDKYNRTFATTYFDQVYEICQNKICIDQLLNNKIYWIEKLNFNLDFGYDPFNLEYLSATSYTNGDFSVDNIPGKITMNFINTDSLSAGKIAELTFLSVVPDTQITPLTIRAYNFRTDSIMFLDIIPIDNSGTLVSQGKCGISTLNYTGLLPSLLQNTPNPWKNQTTINFIISEKSIINLELYSLEGILLKKILYNVEYNPGTYSIILNAQGLSNGVYFYILRTNTFVQSKSMLLIE